MSLRVNARPRRASLRDNGTLVANLGTAATLVLGWALLAGALKSPTFPGPLAVWRALFNPDNQILIHSLASVRRIAISLALALAVGVPIGLALGRNRRLDALVAPFLYLTYPVPKIVFLPVVLVLFGLGDASRIFLIFLTVTYQILVTTRDAARALPATAFYSITSLGASKWDAYRHVLFPYTLPKVFTALRISVGTAIAVLFFAESFATNSGLGYLIMDAWGRMAYDVMFASILVMSLMGLVLYFLIQAAESRFCRWSLAASAGNKESRG